jgi:hypothetical protein
MYAKKDGTPIANLFGIDIQEHEDLGIGQPLQQLWTLPSGGGGFGLAMPGGTRELVLGMDGRNTGQYAKMPMRNPGLQTFPDNSSYTHRSQTSGYYGWFVFFFSHEGTKNTKDLSVFWASLCALCLCEKKIQFPVNFRK